MQIKKRNFPAYVALNCLTLGVYGMVVALQINKEVDALCKGDREQPMSYSAAFLFRAIAPFVGLLFGLISSLLGLSVLELGLGGWFMIADSMKFASVLLGMAYWCVIFTAGGTVISSIYYNYWWYKQSNRLKLNANRYGLKIKEGGIDTFLLRTVVEVLFAPVTFILVALSCLAPTILLWLFTFVESEAGLVLIAMIIFFVCVLISLFGAELTTGANFSMFFMFKNLNRFADVYRNGAMPFDPMAYEYYPSVENKYPVFLPGMLEKKPVVIQEPIPDPEPVPAPTTGLAALIGVSGSCAGYKFDIMSGEEVIIGKDATVSQVVIDPIFKQVSRKHVGVCYDMIRDMYRVVDYSSNGTWADNNKLMRGKEYFFPRGTELKLANDKNRFTLG